MPRRKPLSCLEMSTDMVWALNSSRQLDGKPRCALEAPVLEYNKIVTEFGALVSPLPWAERARVVHQLCQRLVLKSHPEQVLLDILNVSGVSSQEMEAYLLSRAAPVAPELPKAKRL